MNAHQRRHGEGCRCADCQDDRADDGFGDGEGHCWRCGGEGWGIVGTDWDNDDPVNEPDGEIEACNCCGGSGLAEDCVYW